MSQLDKQLDQILAEIAKKAGNLTPITQMVADLVKSSISQNFGSRGRWDGTGTGMLSGGTFKWKPLASSTKKQYKRKGYDLEATLNRSSNGLRTSIQVKPYGKTGIIVTSNKPYAAIHQFGGVIDIPERESEANWKAKKTKDGKYSYRFAKSNAKGKKVISRKFKTKANRIKIPARPFVTLTEKDIQDIIEYVTSLLV